MTSTTKTSHRIAALAFITIGIALVIYTWPPGYEDLQEEKARIIQIISKPGTRYNVQVLTEKGTRLSCIENVLRNWPPRPINRCPVEEFRPLIGQSVKVLHDGKYLYNAEVNGRTILSYRAFRNFQFMMDFAALIMIIIGIVVWRRANLHHL